MLSKYNITKYEYFIVFMFLILCGFTSSNIIPLKTYLLTLLGICYFVKHKKTNLTKVVVCISSYIAIGVLHIYYYNEISSRTILQLPLLIFSAFYITTKLGLKFRYALFNTMYVLAIISLFFWLCMLLFNYVPSISFLEKPFYKSIFIYNIRINEIAGLRNCGPFWEPGAFAGYICLTFLLFFDSLKDLITTYKFKCSVLLLALLTTFSTQGYIVIILVFMLYYLNKKSKIKALIYLLPLMAVSYIIYQELDFIGNKIKQQNEYASNFESNESLSSANRFTTTLVDYFYIIKHPIIGNTLNPQIRYKDHPFIINVIDQNGNYGSGSGITSNIAAYGIIPFLIWFILTFHMFKKNFSVKSSIYCISIFLFLGNAEQYSDQIFYLAMPFMLLTNKKGYDKNINNNS